MVGQLRVLLHDQLIGYITALPGDRNFFHFSDYYLSLKTPPILSQSFIDTQGKLITETKPRQVKLPPFFSNLLPEGEMRRYLAQQTNINPVHEFQLLNALGSDLPGAVVVRILSDRRGDQDQEMVKEDDQKLHFSLAGVQLKFSALLNHQKVTIPLKGIGGHWIVKLPSQRFPFVPENEYSMLHLAKQVGIPIPENRLIAIKDIQNLPELGFLNGRQALLIKRFDRNGNQRIHMEDLAQVFNVYPHDKYNKVSHANIAAMIFKLMGDRQLVEFIQRLVFTILIGNGDMHLKNWSLLYSDKYTPTLSPAYDLVSTIPYLPSDTLALSLVGTKKMQEITKQTFLGLCKKAQLPQKIVMDQVQETAEKTRHAWQENKNNYDLPKEIMTRISEHIDSLKL